MPLTIRVETENGQVLRELVDVGNAFADLLSKAEEDGMPLLLAKYIDPYADTTFNSWQIGDFRTDMRALSLITTGAKAEALSAIDALAQSCAKDPHLYLKFVGD
ncbi:MAG: hypothetical protein ABI639_06040 [Thermoanaerobaculia bacterium]